MAKSRSDLRVMIDANILIAGSVWPRWPYEVLEHAQRGDFKLVLSSFIIEQARRHINRRFASGRARFERFLAVARYELIAELPVEELKGFFGLTRDPTDVPIAAAAIRAGASYLISEDKDLTTHDDSTTRLRQQVAVLLSGTFLREVMGWSSDQLLTGTSKSKLMSSDVIILSARFPLSVVTERG